MRMHTGVFLSLIFVLILSVVAAMREDYDIAFTLWCTGTLIAVILDAVDVIGEKLDEIQR